LALVTDASSEGGGIARYNRDLMDALAQSAAISNVVVLPRAGSGGATQPRKIKSLPPSSNAYAWSARALRLALRRRFDAIFCGHLNAVPLAAGLARFTRRPLWVQVHGIDAWEPRGRLYSDALGDAALVTSVSRYTRAKLLTWAGISPHRVRVLPNTISTDFVPRTPAADLIARHRLNGKRVILTVGRLAASERYKGNDRIIAALPDVLARIPNAVYLIVGSGDDQARLEQLARAHAVSERVIFAGQVPAERLADYFACAHVFAMPSTGEGFGIVFLEAAAMGLPVIAGNADGSVDALADGSIGRLVDPTSQDQIVAAIVDALDGRVPPRRDEVQRFSFDNFSKHVDELVRNYL
jgi:phosphatidylinositol alpha-1,6-mannosyltransferase